MLVPGGEGVVGVCVSGTIFADGEAGGLIAFDRGNRNPLVIDVGEARSLVLVLVIGEFRGLLASISNEGPFDQVSDVGGTSSSLEDGGVGGVFANGKIFKVGEAGDLLESVDGGDGSPLAGHVGETRGSVLGDEDVVEALENGKAFRKRDSGGSLALGGGNVDGQVFRGGEAGGLLVLGV